MIASAGVPSRALSKLHRIERPHALKIPARRAECSLTGNVLFPLHAEPRQLLLTSLFGPGFMDEAILLFPLILVTAAVLLDWRSYIGFAGLVVVSVACSGFILAATGSSTRYARVVNVINILLVTVV